jgi:hypothetical protein
MAAMRQIVQLIKLLNIALTVFLNLSTQGTSIQRKIKLVIKINNGSGWFEKIFGHADIAGSRENCQSRLAYLVLQDYRIGMRTYYYLCDHGVDAAAAADSKCSARFVRELYYKHPAAPWR